MQASQQVMVALAQARLPHQQGLAAIGPQDLLGSPAGVGRMIGLQLQQPRRIHPHVRPAWGIDLVRGLQQRDPLSPRGAPGSRGRTCQYRAQQAQLADAVLGQQQLDEHPRWPAAFGQLGIEYLESAGDTTRTAARQLGGQPERGVDDFRARDRRAGCQHGK